MNRAFNYLQENAKNFINLSKSSSNIKPLKLVTLTPKVTVTPLKLYDDCLLFKKKFRICMRRPVKTPLRVQY